MLPTHCSTASPRHAFRASLRNQSLFQAVGDAGSAFGSGRVIVEDAVSGALTYRELLAGARILGQRFEALSAPGEAVGLLLPNSNGVAMSLLGLLSSGRVAAMINYTAGPANVAASIRTAIIRTIVSSRAFIAKASLDDIVEAAGKAGAKFVWLEDLRGGISKPEKLLAALLWRRPLGSQDAKKPAVILFTSGSEGTPKAVVLSNRNLLANARQVEARIALSAEDRLLNVLPVFHSYGLTGGTILPLLAGVRFFLYPSPLHYKLIPQTAAKIRPTIMFATDTFLTAYARTASDSDFESLRLVVAGAEAVRAETRRVWRERFGAQIVEGYGMTEASPVVAVNSATHGRDGSVGRLLPGMRMQVEPVEGIEEGGRLWVAGPNVMMGYMSSDRPGELVPLETGWHDSGDVVAIDREGFIQIRGRTKRFAKIAGEMVSLGAVEMLVQSLWPEDHHAVVSVPDKRRGERIVLVTTAEAADAQRAAPVRQADGRRRADGAGRHRQGRRNAAAGNRQDRLHLGAADRDGDAGARCCGVGVGNCQSSALGPAGDAERTRGRTIASALTRRRRPPSSRLSVAAAFASSSLALRAYALALSGRKIR